VKGLLVGSSYAMDLGNFLSVLTGQDFYVRQHREAFETWHPRLSAGASAALGEALALLGSPMLGPPLCLWISAVPDFDAVSLPDLLEVPERIRQHLQHTPYYPSERWPLAASVCQRVLPVVRELESLGFQRYWEDERRPLIEAAIRRFTEAIAPLHFDLTGAVADMLGPPRRRAEPVTVILCSFVAPHGVKVCGPVYLTDIREGHQNTIRTALHEMFHPPFREEEVAAELAALAGDPLVRSTFEAQDPVHRYATITGWIEENVVEAMAQSFADEAGFADDPISRYHLDHDGKLSVVLLAHMRRSPKAPTEPFATYFRRVVGAMPVGSLDREYAALHGQAAP
jgi:hypothetical protein